jgi:hypothetical protein
MPPGFIQDVKRTVGGNRSGNGGPLQPFPPMESAEFPLRFQSAPRRANDHQDRVTAPMGTRQLPRQGLCKHRAGGHAREEAVSLICGNAWMFAVAAPKVADRWLLMAHQAPVRRYKNQRHWATLPVAVVRLGRPTPTPVDTALARGEPDLLGLPMQRQVDEVVGQLYLLRPEPIAECKFVGVHRARYRGSS